MDVVDQIFGVALEAAKRNETAPQTAEAVVNPPSPAVPAAASDALSDPEVVTVPMTRLAQRVWEEWDRNVSHRETSGVSARLQYDFDVHTQHFTASSIRAMFDQGIPEATAKKLYAPITFSKNRALQALMDDMMQSAVEPIFHIDATPMPEVSKRVDAEAEAELTEQVAPLFAAIAERTGGAPMPPQAEQSLRRVLSGMASAVHDRVLGRRDRYAKIRAERMERKVWDMLVEGGWETENQKCMEDFCVFGTALMAGPIPRAVAANKSVENEDGVVKYERKVVVKPVFERLNPLDCYPAPDAVEPGDGPFCIRAKFTAESLWRFCDTVADRKPKGGEDASGWNAAVVRGILDEHPNGGVKINTHPESQPQRENAMQGTPSADDCTFEGIRCFMPVRGSELAELGIVRNRDGKKIKIFDYYHVEVIVIDGKVVYCRIMDSRFPVPISKAVCYNVPGAFWGESLADKMKLAQTMLNNIAKSMFVNLMAAGPMVWVEDARLKDKNGFKIAPWSVIHFDAASPGYGGIQQSGTPIGFLQAPSIQPELVQAWNTWVAQADNDSGIPRFAEGSTGGQLGALRTSGGLQQMTDHMLRGSKAILRRYDNGLVKGPASLCAEWILAYDTDLSLKGDVTVRTVGLFGRLAQSLRSQNRLQALNLIGSSQFFQTILGSAPEIPLALMKSYLKELEVDVSSLPGEEELAWLKQLAKISQLAQAAQAEQGVAAQAAPPEEAPGGMQSGVPPVDDGVSMGGVAERRSVA